VNAMSFDQLNNNLAKGDWDILMDGWSTGPDPTYLLSIQTCGTLPDENGENGNTDAFFCNKQYDRLYQQQQTQFDPKERAAAWADVDKKLSALAPAVPWIWDKQPLISSADVNGVVSKYNAQWDLAWSSLK